LLPRLVDQHHAKTIVEPMERDEGFWFGGGNIVQGAGGAFYVVGRYRNRGDSRRGIAAGTRGFRLAVLASPDGHRPFEPVLEFSKEDLSHDGLGVLSIEGSCLVPWNGGVRLYVSTEKDGVEYPPEVASFLKPGTGVWTIDVLESASIGDLKETSVVEVLQSSDPANLHVKDPFWVTDANGTNRLWFCTHPFNWSSHNTGYLYVDDTGHSGPTYNVISRGNTWDVAMMRATAVMHLPRVGPFADGHSWDVLFYDGGECLRPLEPHSTAVSRPRGYSCEELGGALLVCDSDLTRAERISANVPLFVSPWGTGASRYVDVLETPSEYIVSWEQSQTDRSQPLVMNRVSRAEVESILSDA